MVDPLTDEEERYTFSALMTLLIESERKLKELYETTWEGTSEGELKYVLSEFARNGLKRLDMIRRARLESVVEMMLEPITGLKLAELLSKINTTIENAPLSDVEKLMILEETVSQLYARASPRIMQMSADTGQLLMTLSRESMERKLQLERHVSPA